MTTLDALRLRVASVCASSPFAFTQAQTPFSWDLQPSGVIDRVFRIESEAGAVIGGFNFTEDRNDLIHIWVARKYASDADGTYQRLLVDVNSMRAAVIRDGLSFGEYSVPDGGALSVNREANREFAVGRLTVPVNYEAVV